MVVKIAQDTGTIITKQKYFFKKSKDFFIKVDRGIAVVIEAGASALATAATMVKVVLRNMY